MIKYYKTIAFSKSILKSHFKFEDKFQVLPINMDCKPQSPYARHFPFFLEYSIEYSNNEPQGIELQTIRLNKEKEILNILSCLTNHRFFSYTPTQNVWGIKFPNKTAKEMTKDELLAFDNEESDYIHSGYYYCGMKEDLQIDCFSEFVSNNIFKNNAKHKYYINNPIDNYQSEIFFPDTLCYALQNYYNLSSKIKKKVNSCIYLACDGMDISEYKRSLSFLSYVSAIEGLVCLEVDNNEIKFFCPDCQSIELSPYKCPKCGRPIWGIKQKFIDFLSRFVFGSEKSQEKYKHIYNLRSKLTHTGKLFISDYEFSLRENDMEKDYNDRLMNLETLQLFRISLDSWLRYENKKNK